MLTFPLCSLALSGLLISLGARAENVQQKPPSDRRDTTESHLALEPKAIALLKAMSSCLATARTMTFTAITTYESPSRIGPPLVYTTLSEVTLQRPNKLRVIVPSDGSASEFYYDGKTMMAYAPGENLVAVADAPPTIDAVLKAVYDLAAIYFPFTDVIVADPYQDIADGLKQAFYIGQSHVVGGTTTDMIAIANDQVFAQIWIGTDDKLPRKIRVVYRDDPSRLRHQVEFSNWHLDESISADTFASSRASSAPRIQFTRPDPKLPGNSMPPARVKPTKIQ
ncbi:hypothetical protein C7H19_21450 [Aphanothece hegewaldii CCALA 016]|uniref:DUF2092 domain-containing protein n=2 Tax=Aphanothece TaxID=1121 RepID=A0A2T1LS82_9CHRO|nr:DUF2092 domain-containing protein [Aphanothece hegewaldii]PSF32466.1 hypothetical protein C7H19_21450 [Aphanothece hegewaldii CCALA 016]